MTEDQPKSEDLVQRLLAVDVINLDAQKGYSVTSAYNRDGREAADRILELEAENARLREKLAWERSPQRLAARMGAVFVPRARTTKGDE